MTAKEVLAELKTLGNEKTYAVNSKAGAGTNQFGVKMGDIRNLAKKIKTNHALGQELWKTGNADAQFLALLIIKPQELSIKELDEMVETISFSHVADWFNSYIVKEHAAKEQLRIKWLKSKNKWALRSGWSLMAGKIARDSVELDIAALLQQLKKEMPKAVPEVQWTMNFALAYIGIHHPSFRKQALALGEEMGIYRDYPVSKGCTSPFAPIWINEMVRRQGN
jgi:3-methyladenine DNA glycosylase AlkD|eukprot:TRINITY_DN11252_c0_g1_i1.p1 TRINITY_DN11252_c0_g1~~TRINITY_DN11252_c0_g1_i1.p1  ORF type:complete len:223 (-),score=9.68 TRINITY_DN11252_c0_g1_i1:39-707(-)